MTKAKEYAIKKTSKVFALSEYCSLDGDISVYELMQEYSNQQSEAKDKEIKKLKHAGKDLLFKKCEIEFELQERNEQIHTF